MSDLKSTLTVLVLLDAQTGASPRKVLFEPGSPRTVLVIFDDAPPQLHDLTKCQLQGNKESGYVVELNAKSLRSTFFRSTAGAAVYHPCAGQLALSFVEDCCIYRIDLGRDQLLEPIYCQFANADEWPVSLAYGDEGQLLAVGGSKGTILVFRISADGESELELSASVSGAAQELTFSVVTGELLVATDFNCLFSIGLADEAEPVSLGALIDDQQQINNMCLKTITCDSSTGLIAYAGVGNQLFVSNPLRHKGVRPSLRSMNRISSLQFVPDSNTLVVLGDGGIELIEFTLDDFRLPVFQPKTMRFQPALEAVGCHHFGDFLFILSVLPE